MSYDTLGVLRDYLPTEYADAQLPNIPNIEVYKAWETMRGALHNNKQLDLDTRNRILNLTYATTGAGGYFNQIQQFMACLDQYETHSVQPNTEYSGVTFMSRPRLCLQSSNLRNNRIMTALDTLNPSSMAFGIRCLLDSNLGFANGNRYQAQVMNSPLFDCQNPFLVPVCNALTSFSGGPDIMIQTDTTAGGYMSEAQTFAIGGDNLQRGNYNLSLTFRDAQHGPIMALFFYWLEYIRCVTRGIMMAYGDDIDDQRLNYTVSIYRFLLDPSRKYITKYAKYTGCFPNSLSIGGLFNKNVGEHFVSAATTFSVQFTCNKVEYLDYAVLMDFNTLMRRYCPAINLTTRQTEHEPDSTGRQTGDLIFPNLPREPLSNWRGLPYVTTDMHGIRLEYRKVSNPVYSNSDNLIDQLLYIDMQEQLANNKASRFVNTSIYTPEVLASSNEYQGVSMKDFFNRIIVNNSGLDGKSFDAVPISTPTQPAEEAVLYDNQ